MRQTYIQYYDTDGSRLTNTWLDVVRILFDTNTNTSKLKVKIVNMLSLFNHYPKTMSILYP